MEHQINFSDEAVEKHRNVIGERVVFVMGSGSSSPVGYRVEGLRHEEVKNKGMLGWLARLLKVGGYHTEEKWEKIA